jgi:hypothetical protein
MDARRVESVHDHECASTFAQRVPKNVPGPSPRIFPALRQSLPGQRMLAWTRFPIPWNAVGHSWRIGVFRATQSSRLPEFTPKGNNQSTAVPRNHPSAYTGKVSRSSHFRVPSK